MAWDQNREINDSVFFSEFLLMNRSACSSFQGVCGSFSSREGQISCFANLLHIFPLLAHFTARLISHCGLIALACSISLCIFVRSISVLLPWGFFVLLHLFFLLLSLDP